jgi:LPS-assembly lipoprotein
MRATALLALVALAACGFHLRGEADLPFRTLYVPNATTGIALDLKRHLQSASDTRVVDDPKAAQAQLQFIEETRGKEILALNAGGRVREYRLVYRVSFRVADGRGGEYVPRSTVRLERDITYDDALALAKETEEQLLFRDMQADMVQQILRRLTAARIEAGKN